MKHKVTAALSDRFLANILPLHVKQVLRTFSERGARHKCTWDETQVHAGRRSLVLRPAFANKDRDANDVMGSINDIVVNSYC